MPKDFQTRSLPLGDLALSGHNVLLGSDDSYEPQAVISLSSPEFIRPFDHIYLLVGIRNTTRRPLHYQTVFAYKSPWFRGVT